MLLGLSNLWWEEERYVESMSEVEWIGNTQNWPRKKQAEDPYKCETRLSSAQAWEIHLWRFNICMQYMYWVNQEGRKTIKLHSFLALMLFYHCLLQWVKVIFIGYREWNGKLSKFKESFKVLWFYLLIIQFFHATVKIKNINYLHSYRMRGLQRKFVHLTLRHIHHHHISSDKAFHSFLLLFCV